MSSSGIEANPPTGPGTQSAQSDTSTGRVISIPERAPPKPSPTALPALIAREKKRRRRRMIGWSAAATLVLLAVATTWWLERPRPAPLSVRFRTVAVTHGDLTREVRATGHVEAVSTVSVGAEISGRIATVEVSYNDHVKAGQVLARFDRNALEAQRAQSDAMAITARAQLAQARVDLAQARRNALRADDLFTRKVMSQSEHEAATTALEVAAARVGAAEATLAAQEAFATVARTNLDHTVIRAPIDGIIITRDVDPGQTVASMLQTPVLFTVAADLRKMQVVAAVDEADIAEVALSQAAPFSVNAYQNRVFIGTVTEVRNAARVVQDVVTYGAVIAVDNLDLALKPTMTASVRINTGTAKSVDAVPNAALRFTPPGEQPAQEPGVWLLDGQRLARRGVRPGLSDGELTAIGVGDLPAGARVIVDLTPEGKRAYELTQPK